MAIQFSYCTKDIMKLFWQRILYKSRNTFFICMIMVMDFCHFCTSFFNCLFCQYTLTDVWKLALTGSFSILSEEWGYSILVHIIYRNPRNPWPIYLYSFRKSFFKFGALPCIFVGGFGSVLGKVFWCIQTHTPLSNTRNLWQI